MSVAYFKGSQLNWEALTKEAYAIYMSIKKLTYYLEDAEITLRSDHLPLKRFLQRNTLNTKVNNWAVEISPFKITFEYIKGIKNTLVDTMSRLIALDPDNQLVDEPEGFEYGYYTFDNIDPIKTQVEVNKMTNKNHYFLKACISKHITPQIEWDDVVPLACAAYNFLPNEHSKESPFFLMFGRDAILPLNKLLQPQV